MTESDKIKATKANKQYGAKNWHWSDECLYIHHNDCQKHHICSINCHCADCSAFDDEF